MSDTKQQCPQCGSENRKNRLAVDSTGVYGVFPPKAIECTHPWHDSPVEGSAPSAAGSGAREFTLRNRGQQFADDYCSAEIYDLMEAYADHCTAPLREENARLKQVIAKPNEFDSLSFREALRSELITMGFEDAKKCAAAEAELTAERTRREAAERELKELRIEQDRVLTELTRLRARLVVADDRAALRGKGE